MKVRSESTADAIRCLRIQSLLCYKGSKSEGTVSGSQVREV